MLRSQINKRNDKCGFGEVDKRLLLRRMSTRVKALFRLVVLPGDCKKVHCTGCELLRVSLLPITAADLKMPRDLNHISFIFPSPTLPNWAMEM